MELWTPNNKPPQAIPEVVEILEHDIIEKGLSAMYSEGVTLMQKHQPFLREYMKQITADKLGDFIQDTRPIRAIRVGAVMAHLTYLRSGYDETIDEDMLSLGITDAELEGIPEAFIITLPNDGRLKSVLEVVTTAPEMQDGVEEWGYDELVALGGGCVRHFMAVQQVMAA